MGWGNICVCARRVCCWTWIPGDSQTAVIKPLNSHPPSTSRSSLFPHSLYLSLSLSLSLPLFFLFLSFPFTCFSMCPVLLCFPPLSAFLFLFSLLFSSSFYSLFFYSLSPSFLSLSVFFLHCFYSTCSVHSLTLSFLLSPSLSLSLSLPPRPGPSRQKALGIKGSLHSAPFNCEPQLSPRRPAQETKSSETKRIK